MEYHNPNRKGKNMIVLFFQHIIIIILLVATMIIVCLCSLGAVMILFSIIPNKIEAFIKSIKGDQDNEL